jgi:hypothetical protein
MKRKYITILSALALGFASCQEGDLEMEIANNGAMIFNVTASTPHTRVANNEFEAQDRVGLYVTDYTDSNTPAPLQLSGNRANNEAMVYDGANWNTERVIYWGEGKSDVYAYYPYSLNVEDIYYQYFAVATDQDSEGEDGVMGGYEASDFLWAKAEGVSQEDGDVQLQFKHMCTKMIIKLVKGEKFTDEFPEDTEVFLHSTIPTATIDFTRGYVSKDIYGERRKIKARQVSIDTYEVILIPQSITERLPFIEVAMGGISYLTEDMFSYLPGVQYSVSITLNSSPEQIEVEIGGNIENWK